MKRAFSALKAAAWSWEIKTVLLCVMESPLIVCRQQCVPETHLSYLNNMYHGGTNVRLICQAPSDARLQLDAFDYGKSTSWPKRVTNQCRVDPGQRDEAEKVIKKLSSANAARFHTKHIEGDSLVRVPKAQSQKHQVGRAGLSFWPEELCGPHGSSNGKLD